MHLEKQPWHPTPTPHLETGHVLLLRATFGAESQLGWLTSALLSRTQRHCRRVSMRAMVLDCLPLLPLASAQQREKGLISLNGCSCFLLVISCRHRPLPGKCPNTPCRFKRVMILCQGTMAFKGFPGGSAVRIHLQCRKQKINPWVRKIPWRRAWQPTAVFLPGESPGQGSLVGYSSWGHKELAGTEAT